MRRSMLMMGLALPLLATAAIAQTPPQPGPQPVDAAADAAARGPTEADFIARREAERARREADVAVVLELSPRQQALFHAMLADRRGPHGDGPQAGGPGARPPHGPGRPDGPPEEPKDRSFAQHLQDAQQHLDERTRDAQARLSDAKAFYAALNPRQQQKFDALERLQHGSMHEGPMRDGPMHEGPMHGGPMHDGPMHDGPMHDGPPPPPPGGHDGGDAPPPRS